MESRGVWTKNMVNKIKIALIIFLIVVIVVFGLFVTNKVMCSGIVLTSAINNDEMPNIWQNPNDSIPGVVCMGEKSEFTIYGGGNRQIVCAIASKNLTKYSINYMSGGILTEDGEIVDLNSEGINVLGSGWSGIAAPENNTIKIATLDIPSKIKETSLKIDIKIVSPEYLDGKEMSLAFKIVPGPSNFEKLFC